MMLAILAQAVALSMDRSRSLANLPVWAEIMELVRVSRTMPEFRRR